MMYQDKCHSANLLLFSIFFLIVQVVSAVLENYESPYAKSENNDDTSEDKRARWVNEVLKAEGHEPSSVTILARVSSWKDIRAARGELNLTM